MQTRRPNPGMIRIHSPCNLTVAMRLHAHARTRTRTRTRTHSPGYPTTHTNRFVGGPKALRSESQDQADGDDHA